MHKDTASYKLDKTIEQLKGSIWLLGKCTHTHGGHGYAHHVRDRITESLITELTELIERIELVQKGIADGLDNEEKDSSIPF